jgi:glycosyltransferase involved in cell wall biosynthesis
MSEHPWPPSAPPLPLVSAAIPAYNAARFLADAVDSVLAQTYPNLEICIVDDGSTDNTPQVIERYRDEPRVRAFRQVNAGPAAARNHAVRESKGAFLAFLDADDLWLPDKIERQLRVFFEQPDIGIVYTDVCVLLLSPDGQWNPAPSRLCCHRGHAFREVVNGTFIGPSSTMIPRGIFDKYGGFPPDLITAEDRYLFARIAHDYPIDYVDEELVIMRRHGGNISWDPAREPQTLDFLRKIAEQFPECSLSKGGWMRTTYADTARTSGDDALHAGRMGQARRELWQACRYRPWRLSNWLRLALAMLPRPMLDGLRRIRHREER